jgi:hypothetical protein
MTDTVEFDTNDNETLVHDISDEALEASAGNAVAPTIAFCSGLDSCPA